MCIRDSCFTPPSGLGIQQNMLYERVALSWNSMGPTRTPTRTSSPTSVRGFSRGCPLGRRSCTRSSVHDNLSCTRLQNYAIGASLLSVSVSVSVSVPWNSSYTKTHLFNALFNYRSGLPASAVVFYGWMVCEVAMSWSATRDGDTASSLNGQFNWRTAGGKRHLSKLIIICRI